MKIIEKITAAIDSGIRAVFTGFNIDSYVEFGRTVFAVERRQGQLLIWFGFGQLFLSKLPSTR